MAQVFCVVTAVLLTAGGARASHNAARSAACDQPYRQDLAVHTPRGTVQAEAARNPYARAQGLSDRACLPPDQAMLFVFDSPGLHCFWMKDMAFGIDIVWLNDARHVVHVVRGADPRGYPEESFCPDRPARYVLEVAAGQADRLGLASGRPVTF